MAIADICMIEAEPGKHGEAPRSACEARNGAMCANPPGTSQTGLLRAAKGQFCSGCWKGGLGRVERVTKT